MDKKELFKKSIVEEQQFKNYKLDDLLTMGSFLGTNQQFFKKIYKTNAFNTQPTLEFQPEMGAAVTVIFDIENKGVTINRSKMELKFSQELFLTFMNLIDVCFLEIISVGSVVQLDVTFMPERIKKMMESSSQGALVMIVGHKVGLEDEAQSIYIDYVAEMWPFGQYIDTPRIFTSNVIIKNTVHKGMTNDFERKYTWKMREQIIENKSHSIMFVGKEEKVDKKLIESDGES